MGLLRAATGGGVLVVAVLLGTLLANAGRAHAQTVPHAGSVIAPVPPAGGTVSGLGAAVDIPPGAGPIVVVLVPQVREALPPSPPGYTLAGTPFTLSVQTQAGQQVVPSQPIIIRLPLPAGRPLYPGVYRLHDNAWYLVPTAVQVATVIAEVGAGGVYALFVRPIPSDLPAVGRVSQRLWYWPAGAATAAPVLLWLLASVAYRRRAPAPTS